MPGKFSARQLWVVGAVVLVAGYLAYQWLGTASITVVSEPAGAIVYIDGQQRGVTPISGVEVDAGRHRVLVTHSHYAPFDETISFTNGDHLERRVEFRAGEGTFELLSNPRGAWVEIDGTRLDGVTPTEWRGPSGPHVIRMGLQERHVVEESHVLKHDEVQAVNLNLNIDPHGSMTFSLSPRSAKVTFIDSDVEYEPKVRLRIGEYAVRVSAPGYVTQEFRYNVRYGDNLHSVTLERAYGQLVVNHQPEQAEVTARYTLNGTTRTTSITGPTRLPVGQVEVRARALGYRTATRRINLGQQGATVRFRLERMQVTPGREFADPLRSGGQGPVMVVVPAGRFQMGDADGPVSEQPVREVTLTQPFAVSKYEVSVGEYLAFAEATGRGVRDKVDTSDLNRAMGYVTVEDALAYTGWLTDQTGAIYRLPSEAEWEYFTRAGSQTQYFFGDDPERLCEFGNVADQATRQRYRDWDTLACDDGMVKVGAVGQFAPNPFGLHDLVGNVAEWVADCGMPEYSRAPVDGRPAVEGEGCASHGYRGGSWDSMAAEARSAYRNSASNAIDDRGIRLVREL